MSRIHLIGLLAAVITCTGCDRDSGGPTGPSPDRPARTVVAGQSIQAAIDAAPSGSTISVRSGVYAERLLITKSVTLQGSQAVLDGLAGTLDGRFAGIEVRADNVEISGFTIQNFERGIEADSVSGFRLHDNEVRNNTSKDPPPISAGVTKSDGVVLFSVRDSEIADNFIHDNGSIGVLLRNRIGASGANDRNIIRRNRIVNNGTQQGLAGSGYFGASVMLIRPGSENQLLDNEMTGSYWGAIIYSDSNTIRGNRITSHLRAGILVQGARNVIENNSATGNGIGNFDPGCRHDLLDYLDIDNAWRNNVGRFGIAYASSAHLFISFTCE